MKDFKEIEKKIIHETNEQLKLVGLDIPFALENFASKYRKALIGLIESRRLVSAGTPGNGMLFTVGYDGALSDLESDISY